MSRPETTEIIIAEDGTETHESWLLVHANRFTGQTHLFGSDIQHQSFVGVSVSRCERRRDLNHDWLHATEELFEWNMSEAQWGAFVSSLGNGSGVPATLDYIQGVGRVGRAPFESRLEESSAEVRAAGSKALQEVQAAHAAVMEGFERGAGKKEMRELHRGLDTKMRNLPSNMEFAASSLTKHVEDVTTKARADIEAMVLMAEGQRIDSLSTLRDQTVRTIEGAG